MSQYQGSTRGRVGHVAATTRLQHTVCSSATCDCSLACCMYLILRVATGVCSICTYTYNVLLCKSTKVNSDTSICNCYIFLGSVHLNLLDPLCIPVQLSVKFSTTLASGKTPYSALALPRPRVVFSLQPSEVGYNYYMSILVI